MSRCSLLGSIAPCLSLPHPVPTGDVGGKLSPPSDTMPPAHGSGAHKNIRFLENWKGWILTTTIKGTWLFWRNAIIARNQKRCLSPLRSPASLTADGMGICRAAGVTWRRGLAEDPSASDPQPRREACSPTVRLVARY